MPASSKGFISSQNTLSEPLSHRIPSIFVGLSLLALSACNTTRWVPEDQLLFDRYEIRVYGQKQQAKSLDKILKQKPNTSFVGVKKGYLKIYNLGDPEKTKGLSGWFIKRGEPPVLIDSTKIDRSVKQMGYSLFDQGFFENQVSYTISKNPKKPKKGEVLIEIWPGPAYQIDSISTEIQTPEIRGIVLDVMKSGKLKVGETYAAALLESERGRITDRLREEGYFGFPKDAIRFIADTLKPGPYVGLHMLVENQSFQNKDSAFTQPFRTYRIGQIEFDDEYDLASSNKPYQDTSTFDGYRFLYRHKNEKTWIRERVPVEATHLTKGDLYRSSKVQETYRHLNGLNVFQSADISFSPDLADSTGYSLLTRIRLSPKTRRNFTTELEGTNTSGNFGIGGSVGWTDRNLFRGAEIFDFRVYGAVEAQYSSNQSEQLFNTFEFGTEAGVNFPKFLIPFNSYLIVPKRMRPTSRVSLKVLRQSRLEYDRILFNARLEYSWWESQTKKHTLALADWNFTNVLRVEDEFLEDLLFPTGFISMVYLSTKYNFQYNEQAVTKPGQNFQAFYGTLEFASNVVAPLLSSSSPDLPYDQILGVGVAQFFKVDADYRYFFDLGGERFLVARAYAGAMFGYGNGQYLLPFEKFSFGGGTNDNRGWNAYRLGPGAIQGSSENVNIAPFKITGNLEYRFPISKLLKGAVFADAGNIWFIQPNLPIYFLVKERGEEAFIENAKFLKDMAIGGGAGLRSDFGFFVLRFDAGLPLRQPFVDPSTQSHWIISKLGWSDVIVNFGIGYPF